jgi:hypothetical protein
MSSDLSDRLARAEAELGRVVVENHKLRAELEVVVEEAKRSGELCECGRRMFEGQQTCYKCQLKKWKLKYQDLEDKYETLEAHIAVGD